MGTQTLVAANERQVATEQALVRRPADSISLAKATINLQAQDLQNDTQAEQAGQQTGVKALPDRNFKELLNQARTAVIEATGADKDDRLHFVDWGEVVVGGLHGAAAGVVGYFCTMESSPELRPYYQIASIAGGLLLAYVFGRHIVRESVKKIGFGVFHDYLDIMERKLAGAGDGEQISDLLLEASGKVCRNGEPSDHNRVSRLINAYGAILPEERRSDLVTAHFNYHKLDMAIHLYDNRKLAASFLDSEAGKEPGKGLSALLNAIDDSLVRRVGFNDTLEREQFVEKLLMTVLSETCRMSTAGKIAILKTCEKLGNSSMQGENAREKRRELCVINGIPFDGRVV